MFHLKKFIEEYATKKEVEIPAYDEPKIRAIEREMERNRKEIDAANIIEQLKKIEHLRKGFSEKDWEAIEKEISKMQ